tara:strand:- start:27511 stop:31875 length:4365 start_codon:yes stop_codon:yes gene_type:complete
MPLKRLILPACCLFLALNLEAQLKADFKADTTRACAPKQIQFTDLSTGPRTIIYWSWSFGNRGYSTLQNPSRVYTTPGTYTVTLVVSDGIDTAKITKTAYLHLFKTPKADYTLVEITKCTPVEIQFTDKTVLGDAPILTYKWDFGDLSPPGTGKNARHKYNFPGTYSVLFTVVDTNGCTNTSTPKNVSVGAPKANFTGTPRDDCLPPLTTTFKNLSTFRPPETYLWKFGDGGTSTQKTPSYTYNSSGSFDVQLIVTDKFGCKDTLIRKKYVNIGSINADFDIPDTLCINSTDSAINLSKGAQNFKWYYGTSGYSTDRYPILTFTKAGYTTIKLVASSGVSCVDSITKTVYIEKVQAGFTISYKDICDPNTINFKDSSSGDVKSVRYHLDMGVRLNHKYFNTKNATFKYPISYCTNTFWKVNYEVRSSRGCTSKVTKQVKIFNDQLNGLATTSSNCTPADVTFDATPCMRFPAVKWKWNFGTGNPADTSNLRTPTNVIRVTKGGRYIADVTVVDSAGCVYTHNVPYEVGEKQKADFKMDDDTVCYKDTVHFTNLSVDTSKIHTYSWSFGDFTFDYKKDTKHAYESLGRKKVQLLIWNYTCDDTISKYVYVSGPIASIISFPDCKDKLNQTFEVGIGGSYNRFKWDFGDTTGIDSVNKKVKHRYKYPLPYIVTLVAYNDTTGCTDTAKVQVSPGTLKANFNFRPAGSSICRGTELEFDATLSQGSINGRYFWDFGDGGTDNYSRKTKHQFNKSGIFLVRLIVVSTDSCMDTTMVPIKVFSPNPDFKLLNANICNGDSLFVQNLSKPDTTISLYRWQYGPTLISQDSNLRYRFSLPDSTIDSSKLINSDTMDLMLRLTDVFGCIEEFKVPLSILYPRAVYETTDSTLCRGNEITFIDSRLPSSVSHRWYFGDGDSSLIDEPKHVYNKSGNFLARYVVESAPCSDTMTIPISVQAIDSVLFDASIRDTNCYPATIFFNDYSKGDSITWRTWDFGDGIAPIRSPLKDSLTKTFLAPGKFDIKVVVETSNGCKDSVTYFEYIEIRGPYSRFSVSPDSVCINEPITFYHDTSNLYTYTLIWDFADGRVDSTGIGVKQLDHKYQMTGILEAILLFKDSSGECEWSFKREIVVEDVRADFKFDLDSVGCQPFTTRFKDLSVDGNQWSWNFGDGNSSNTQDPANTFKDDGTFPVTLIHTNSRNGCKDTASRNVLVYPLPKVQGNGDTALCLGDSVQLGASGARTYLWSPDYKITRLDIVDPKAAPDSTYQYRVVGTDSNNCKNESVVNVFIQQVPTITLPDDQVIIIGEEINVNTSGRYGSSYRWEPPTGLSCSDCPNPTAKPLKNTTYTLYVSDSLGCFETKGTFIVEVQPKLSLDVPDVFTPNGDGSNDVISPAGWGIKELLEFKVYNRWGELVFEATKETPGWDGYYKGELQNMETYVYYARALSYDDEVISKEGYFTLVR